MRGRTAAGARSRPLSSHAPGCSWAQSPDLGWKLLSQPQGLPACPLAIRREKKPCHWKEQRLSLVPDSVSYRQSFPDTYVSISQHRMPFKGKFHKTPVHEEIIVGFQKKRKPGWLNIAALSENHKNRSRNECDRRRLPASRGKGEMRAVRL